MKGDPVSTAAKAASPITSMAHQMLPAFNEDTDKWKPYLIKTDAYFEANGITDSAKKRALLVAALSTQTVQVLAG